MRDVRIEGLPPELDGLRIAHLSDFHLGVPGRGRVAVRGRGRLGRRAPAGPRLPHRRPADAPRGRPLLENLLARVEPFFVFGNHDIGVGRDPFCPPAAI